MIKIDKGVGGPESLAKLVASDDLARSLEKSDENLEGLLLNANALTGAAEFARAHIRFVLIESVERS